MYSKNQIYQFQKYAGNHVDDILQYFSIDYHRAGKCYAMCCPIHEGDNESACTIYPSGDTIGGFWKCRTYGCHTVFRPSILGFIRGVLSHKNGWRKNGDPLYNFRKTIDIALSILKQNVADDEIDESIDKAKFTKAINNYNIDNTATKPNITREYIQQSLCIPSSYIESRGISREILKKYDVGTCIDKTKPMFERAVFPVYDPEYKGCIGCVGRSIYPECSKCSCYHNPIVGCPHKDYKWKYHKWLNSRGFNGESTLFNYWFAKEKINQLQSVILVEGCIDCLKLVQYGFENVVAIFGDSLTDRQRILLEKLSVLDIIILTDNDNAGRNASIKISKQCQKLFNIKIPKYPSANKDVGEMTKEEIECMLKQT